MNNIDCDSSASKLTILSANVNGLGDSAKRREFFLHIEMANPDIICHQIPNLVQIFMTLSEMKQITIVSSIASDPMLEE